MNPHHSERPKVLFLFSDTGGGHRSAAEAIIESLELLFPNQIETEMVDIFRAAPPPLALAIPTYPAMARMTAVWETTYKISNGRRRARFIQDAFWPYVRRAAIRLVDEHPANLIVSVHPIPNMPVLRAITQKTPYITVVTDLVSTHAMWYDRRTDLVVVPTEEAWQRGIKLGLRPNQMEVVGLPVADRFWGERSALAYAWRSQLEQALWQYCVPGLTWLKSNASATSGPRSVSVSWNEFSPHANWTRLVNRKPAWQVALQLKKRSPRHWGPASAF